MPINNTQLKEQLLQLIRQAVTQDKQLRDDFKVGEKFRFIRDRLNTLLGNVEDHLSQLDIFDEKAIKALAEDEILVYVYLYNAQGILFKTWDKMVTQSVFYEYSVNRPIYLERPQVETYIRSKPNKVQHGYITVAVKKDNILATPPDMQSPTDPMGQPLIKVREGALHFDRLLSFNHNGHEYEVNSEGKLEKKEA